MMLTAAEREAYAAGVNAPGVRSDLRLEVLDLDHGFLADVGHTLLDGQLDLNRSGEPRAQCSLTLADVDTDLADLDLRHLLRGWHRVRVDGEWIEVPAFTHRIASAADSGDVAELTLHDKSTFGLLPSLENGTHDEGTPVGRAIKTMFERLGETQFDIPRSLLTGGPRLDKDVEWGGPDPDKAPTRIATRLARAKRLQFYFDPLGRCSVQRPAEAPTVTWTADAGMRVSLTRDLTTIRNTVKAKGRKDLRLAPIDAPAEHLYSPQTLRRGGQNTYLVHWFTDESISKAGELRRAAQRELTRVLRETSEAQFAAPANFLAASPASLLRVERADGRFVEFYPGNMSLGFRGEMSVGYHIVRRRPERSKVRFA